jgi:cholesterol oxidase
MVKMQKADEGNGFATVVRHPSMLARVLNVRKWSERTVIALVMQNVDSALSVRMKRTFLESA